MLTLNITTASGLRANWEQIVAEGKLPGLIASDVVSIAFQAAINSSVDWRVYTGRIDLKAYYRAYGEHIADVVGYQTIELTPDISQGVALYIMQQVPEIQSMMVAANGGAMPPILPPVVPEANE